MKQDMNGVRTPQDLERKYDFSSIGVLKKNYELQKEGLNKVENELSSFARETTRNIEDLQNQVDGNITTWFSSGVPTLNNYPANEWISDTDRNSHLGDLYYDNNTGYAYRFAYDDNLFKWLKITDTDVTQALALANSAKDTADSKRRVFIAEPTPPYDCGDLWINNQELYRCQTAKTSQETYESNDWIKATKYTDDTVANQVANNLTILSGTVTEIIDDVDALSTTMTNTTRVVNEQGQSIGVLQTQQSQTTQTVNTISQTVQQTGREIIEIKETIDVYTVDLDIYNLTILTDESKKPMESREYNIGYQSYYKGSQVISNVTTSSSPSGISISLVNNTIKLSVDTLTPVINFSNELVFDFQYVSNEETYQISKKIIVTIVQKGPQGLKGDTGAQGPKGDNGQDGAKGDKGDTGATGPQGPQGLQGPKGDTGETGTQGPKGDTGNTGNGIQNIQYYYARTTTQTVPSPTSITSTTMPTLDSVNKYLWQKEVINYTSVSTPQVTVLLIAVYGDTGAQGIQGPKGDTGAQGQSGSDGRNSYLHIKWSDDGETFTSNDGETVGRYQGTYTDFNQTDSLIFSDYTWIDTAIVVESQINDLQNQLNDANSKQNELETNLNNNYLTAEQVNAQTDSINKEIEVTNNKMTELKTTIDGVEITVQSLGTMVADMSYSFQTDALTISTSASKINSKFDNTGVKVYNYDKLMAIFNHKGSGVGDLIVTGTAQIGYLKFMKSTKNGSPITAIHHITNVIQTLEDLEESDD